MPIQTEIWRQDIVENLFPANAFSQFAVNHDANVLEGAVVHIPRAGAAPSVTRNRSTFPAAVTTRTDTDLNYQLTEYSTDPVHLKNVERYELSYDKRMSILGEHISALREIVHDDLLHTWVGNGLPAGNIVQTSGTLVGGKRDVVLADILKIKNAMDKANILEEGRYLLMPPDLYNQLFSVADLVNAEILGRHNLPGGQHTQVLGFTILRRSYTPILDAALAVKVKGAAPVATDRQSCVAWSRYSVARALGEVNLFETVNDPLYYGDIYSAQVRAGGIRLRPSGVYMLAQANS